MALRGHPCLAFQRTGGHGGPPLQLLLQIDKTLWLEDALAGCQDIVGIEMAFRTHECAP